MKRDNPTHFLIVIKVSACGKSSKFFLMSCNKFSVCFTYFSIRQRFSRGNDASSLSLGRTKELYQGVWEWENLLGKVEQLVQTPGRMGRRSLAMSWMLNKSGCFQKSGVQKLKQEEGVYYEPS